MTDLSDLQSVCRQLSSVDETRAELIRKRDMMLRDLQGGEEVTTLAEIAGMTRQGVYKILARPQIHTD